MDDRPYVLKCLISIIMLILFQKQYVVIGKSKITNDMFENPTLMKIMVLLDDCSFNKVETAINFTVDNSTAENELYGKNYGKTGNQMMTTVCNDYLKNISTTITNHPSNTYNKVKTTIINITLDGSTPENEFYGTNSGIKDYQMINKALNNQLKNISTTFTNHPSNIYNKVEKTIFNITLDGSTVKNEFYETNYGIKYNQMINTVLHNHLKNISTT